VDRQILSEDTPAIDDASTVQFTMATRTASVGVITVVRVLVAAISRRHAGKMTAELNARKIPTPAGSQQHS
jgi:hypothetical protein